MHFSVKIRNIPIFITDPIYRYFFTGINKYNINRESRIMQKLMRKDKLLKDRKGALVTSETRKRGPSVQTQQRMNVLNKIFMQHITDFMSTGELDARLLNKSIEIMYVKITQDFQILNIHWADNSIDTSDTEEILEKCAFKLRNELCHLHIIGFVPQIKFVRCKHIEQEKEIEKRLKIADYGEDHISSIYTFSVNHVVSAKKLTDSTNETAECENPDNPDDNFVITLPVMKHIIFDLDHAQIMSKIKASLNQSKQQLKIRTRNEQSGLTFASESIPQKIPSFWNQKEQTDQFTKFLKAKILERKIRYKEYLKTNTSRLDEEQDLDKEQDLDDDVDNYDDLRQYDDLEKCDDLEKYDDLEKCDDLEKYDDLEKCDDLEKYDDLDMNTKR
ncbi:uncharacterized protein LOC143174547 [Nomia melanderi]|uniref:uncharacterized protein LOC143174547 n=1 Tax=Nomia melanderi TaxID=2448451 RepID=UPI003FCE95EF